MAEQIRLDGKRILYLTKDHSLIERQLNGENLGPFKDHELLDRISTDTYPTRDCFRFDDEYMATKALTGLRLATKGESFCGSCADEYWVKDNAIRDGNFAVLVAGSSFGCGSSREHFPMSLKAAGIRLIMAKSIEQICAQNCQNIGLPYLTKDISTYLGRLINNQPISVEEAANGLDEISAGIVKARGLFRYFDTQKDASCFPKPQTCPRAMTAVEKIIAEHMDVPYVAPYDIGFIRADKRYSYEIFAPLSYHILRSEIPNATIKDPQSVFLHYDHSVLDISKDALRLAERMRQIAKTEGLTLYDGNREAGAEGICHTIMLDKHTLPGEVILGTDSHTCQLGAGSALAIGIGATEWAGALWTNQVRITVPQSIKFNLSGNVPTGVMAKDIMLYILSLPYIKQGHAASKIFEFEGQAMAELPFDEQVVFPNMSVEGGACTGYLHPNRNSIRFLMARHGLTKRQLLSMAKYKDPDASYDEQFLIDVSRLEPFVATPGDPRNGVPISSLRGNIKVDIAYIGSCTGGKFEDIASVARVLEGNRVNSNVRLYVQTSSRSVYEQVRQAGLIQIIEQSGGKILPSGCGACVNFGPGSSQEGEVTISDTNRNFHGRMGKGNTYLANPAVVAASAVAGKIISPKNI